MVCIGAHKKRVFFGDRDRGGSKRTERQKGGGTRPKVAPQRLGLLTLCRKASISGAPGNSKFSPSSKFRRFDPPPPLSRSLGVFSSFVPFGIRECMHLIFKADALQRRWWT